MPTTYNCDLILWARDTAQLLREQRWDAIDWEHLIEEIEDLGKSERSAIGSQIAIDWEHLIEEIEDLGKSERSAIGSQMERILIHLLKWQYQPQRRSDSWLDFINDGRSQIRRKLEDSPSLRSYPAEILAKEYTRARREAARQTGLVLSIFPEFCPYTIAQVIEDWLPGDSLD